MICAIHEGAHDSVELEQPPPPQREEVTLKYLPDVVPSSKAYNSEVATTEEFGCDNGTACDNDCKLDKPANVTSYSRCCYCHQKLNDRSSVGQPSSSGLRSNQNAKGSSVSLSLLEKRCQAHVTMAHRSTSLPEKFQNESSNCNTHHEKVYPTTCQNTHTTQGTYTYAVDCDMAVDVEDEEKLSRRTKVLTAIVVLLTIITISTISALVYFVVFGNQSGNDPPPTIEIVTAVSVTHATETSTVTVTVPKTDIRLNQTLYCGVFPTQYLPKSSVNVRSHVTNTFTTNPTLPVNDSRIRITSRIVGSEPANIRQYPWQRQNYPDGTSVYNDSGITDANRAQPRVVGGTDAVVPWQVSLWVQGKGVTCGGSIILNNWILTAAHCTHANPKATLWTVYAGTSALSQRNEPPAVKRKVVQIIQHELYPDDMSYDYDVSLMKLDSSLTFTKEIQPICVPPQGYRFPVGMSCFVSGWGAVDGLGLSAHPDVLQHAQIDIIADATCNHSDWLDGLITSRMLCAGKEQGMRDACQGDSGGPLSCYMAEKGVWMLAGSVSWGIDCGLPQLPGVYARMSFFTDWIWRNIGKAEGWIPQT